MQNVDADKAELFKNTAPEKIDPAKHTPVFVFQMGKTTMKEVENLTNTFGEGSAAIIFE